MLLFLLLAAQAEERYATADEALAVVFPGASVFRRGDGFHVGIREDRVVGYAVVVDEVVRTKPLRMLVAIDLGGKILDLALLESGDPEARACRKRRFLVQFIGKGSTDRIELGPGRGILEISGATLSCQAVCRAVRKALQAVAEGRKR